MHIKDRGVLIIECKKNIIEVINLIVATILFVFGGPILFAILILSKNYVALFMPFLIGFAFYIGIRYSLFPLGIARTFEIHENGFVSAERTLREWIKRKDTFISFDEIEIVDVIYKKEYLDRDPYELPLDPEYIRKLIIHIKTGDTRTIEVLDNKLSLIHI